MKDSSKKCLVHSLNDVRKNRLVFEKQLKVFQDKNSKGIHIEWINDSIELLTVRERNIINKGLTNRKERNS